MRRDCPEGQRDAKQEQVTQEYKHQNKKEFTQRKGKITLLYNPPASPLHLPSTKVLHILTVCAPAPVQSPIV